MTGDCLFAGRLEGLRDVGPGVLGLDERASGAAETASPNRVFDEGDHLGRECVGIVSSDKFPSWRERQALSAD
jgi:hypothetical protein